MTARIAVVWFVVSAGLCPSLVFGQGDAPCQAGLVCDDVLPSYLPPFNQCRTAGTGAGGEFCGKAGDAPCQAGFVCGSSGGGPNTCRPPGDGSVGLFCGSPGDASCNTGLACDAVVHLCRLAGSGTDGEACGQSGDAACQSGLLQASSRKRARSSADLSREAWNTLSI